MARDSIIGRGAQKGSVQRMVRRRVRREVAKLGGEGSVVTMDVGEDFCIELLRKAPRPPQHFRKGEYLHVSDLLGKCVRKIALSEKLRRPMPDKPVSDSMALTFAQGTAIHDYIKVKLASGYVDQMYGRWGCTCGSTITCPKTRAKVGSAVCDSCGTGLTNYHELELPDDELGVIGSPDVVLYIPEYEAYYPIEVKSITHDQWKELVRAKPDHVLQVLFYWLLMHRAGYRVPDQVSILYVTKATVFKGHPYKEFQIPTRSAEEVEDRLREYLDDALALKAYKEGGKLPPRSICTNESCAEAKGCHVSIACFG